MSSTTGKVNAWAMCNSHSSQLRIQCVALPTPLILNYSTQDLPPKIIVVRTHLDVLEEKVLSTATSNPGSSQASVGATAASEVETYLN